MHNSITLRILDNIVDLRKIMTNHAKEEGWLYSEDDVQFFFNHQYCDIFAAYTQNGICGILVGTHFSDQNDLNVYNLGLFIVDKQLRGNGVGKKLWDYVIQSISKEKNILLSLNSVPRVSSFYSKNGFFKTSTITISLQRKFEKLVTSDGDDFQEKNINSEAIFDYDKQVLGNSSIERKYFMKQWLAHADFVGQCYKDEGQQLTGYAVVSHTQNDRSSYRLSPMYANSRQDAKKLLEQICDFFIKLTYNEEHTLTINIVLNSVFISFLKAYEFSVIPNSETFLMTNKENTHDELNLSVVGIFPYKFPHECLWVNNLPVG